MGRTPYKIVWSVLLGVIFASCSTGIESTKKIRMTKEDVRLMAKSPEQIFATDIQGSPLSDWEKGRTFLAMTDRALYIFEPTEYTSEPAASTLAGQPLTYTGITTHINPDLKEECVILFSDGKNELRYRTGKTTSEAMKEIESSKIPLLSDLDLVNLWKEKISGMTLWTKSNLWYDDNGDRMPGLKFAKVNVTEVLPTTGDFPMKIKIKGPDGEEAFLHMNYTSDTHDSRNFAALFFLKDPKGKYPNISDEHWSLIQHGKVGTGMTKEECKLSIGNPDEVEAGHTRSQTIDMWQYKDGTYLMFEDGLLTRFRQ